MSQNYPAPVTPTTYSAPIDDQTAYVRQLIQELQRAVAYPERWVGQAARMCMKHAPTDAAWVRAFIVRYGGESEATRAALELLAAPTFLPDRPMTTEHVPLDAASPAQNVPGNDGSTADRKRYRVDGELARLTVPLRLQEPLRVWLVAHELSQRHGGRGWAYKADILDELHSQGVNTSDKTILERWIPSGMDVFFQRVNKSRLFLKSAENAARALTALAMTPGETYQVERWSGKVREYVELPLSTLVETNLPGAVNVYVEVHGSLQEWSARLYAAWLNSVQSHTDRIGRFTLCALWATTPRTLRKWEKLAGITVEKGYSTFNDGERIPFHAYPILRENGSVGAMARVSNRYQAPDMPKHDHGGKSKSVYAAALEVRENAAPTTPEFTCDGTASNGGAGHIGFLRGKSRLFFEDINGQFSKAFKRLRRHTKSDPSDPLAHYIAIGRGSHYAQLYEEASNPQLVTGLFDRVPLDQERSFFHANGGRASFAWWRRCDALAGGAL